MCFSKIQSRRESCNKFLLSIVTGIVQDSEPLKLSAMKLRVILLFAVVLFSVRQVSASPVNRTVKTVSVASFHQIEINAQVLVLLETGLKSGVRIEGDAIAVAQTSFTVRNGVLQVNNPRRYEKSKRPVVYIQTG